MFQRNVVLAGLLAVSPVFISPYTHASTTKDVTVSWGAVTHAFAYQLEELGPGASSFSTVYQGTDTTVVLARALGEYRYRVMGCIQDPSDASLPACSADYAHYSEEAYLNLQNAAATRRVIFLHTDLLGSVAAETNEQGASNQ